ncbi:FecCD family ABC transporter permease [Lutispora thermophila]|uniref:Iron complex transport system permease protein n=1 Tax=Lutispora thermophila DSM 19022 TaxID=1122184 RepID=A0A1M6FUC6_9FIRM|nr:iron ABC transporter permease [Lutispora thermophila]SHJ01305.1 iron complex transport system permease protein [Lutispora thermophila DSM 19022]
MTNKIINRLISFNILLMVFFICFIISVRIGAVDIPLEEILKIIFLGESTDNQIILMDIRLPRVMIAAVLGAGLSAVGGVMQGIFKNPLVDSYTLGMSSGAALGAVISIVTGVGVFGYATTGAFAFLGAISTLFFVYYLSKTKNKVSINSLLLSGVAVSYFISSLISFIMLLFSNKVEHIVFWTMGSLSSATWQKFIFSSCLIVPGVLILNIFARELNIMSLGEESAHYIGVDVERLKYILLTVCSIIVGAVVSTGGTIGFLGLVAPHIVRLIWGADYRRLIPYSAILGASLLMLSDAIGRVIIQPAEIPVGVMTSIMGGPFFVFLLRKQKSKGA